MPTSTRSSAPSTLPCTRLPSLFQDPLLEEPPTTNAPAADRQRHARLVAAASAACGTCPLVAACLYHAVVEQDVAGYVGGTDARQRVEIRRRLGVTVLPEDLDTPAGVQGGHRLVDHDEVVRLRAAHPDESLDELAGRLHCSRSTVKRHLRRARTTPTASRSAPPRPRMDEVWETAAEVSSLARPLPPRAA